MAQYSLCFVRPVGLCCFFLGGGWVMNYCNDILLLLEVCGITVIILGIELNEPSSKPGWNCLYFTFMLILFFKKRYESLLSKLWVKYEQTELISFGKATILGERKKGPLNLRSVGIGLATPLHKNLLPIKLQCHHVAVVICLNGLGTFTRHMCYLIKTLICKYEFFCDAIW